MQLVKGTPVSLGWGTRWCPHLLCASLSLMTSTTLSALLLELRTTVSDHVHHKGPPPLVPLPLLTVLVSECGKAFTFGLGSSGQLGHGGTKYLSKVNWAGLHMSLSPVSLLIVPS